MIPDQDFVMIQQRGFPYSWGTMRRPQAEAAIAMRGREGDQFELVPVPSCRCCGGLGWENQRCSKHQGRTPCAAEGCHRTTTKHMTYFVCGQHWKAYVPPGSPERRALNRLTRLAKKLGYSKTARWPDQLERRWWSLWDGIARRVQRRSASGHLDQAEIERMFGWADD